jgi:uncharacterized membrane protein HdeD (DUF308 family)
MLRVLVHNWWLLGLRGVFALAFAILVFSLQTFGFTWFLQAVAFTSVVELFGLFAFCAGIFTIIAAVRGYGKESGWWLVLLDGSAACLAGVAAVTVPNLTFIALVRLIALWALFMGACELLMARKLRHHLPDEWFLALSGAGSAAFGAYLFFGWASQVHQVINWLGCYALFSSFTMLALTVRLRNLRRHAHLAADQARWDRRIEDLHKAIRCAQAMGCDKVRVFTGMRVAE